MFSPQLKKEISEKVQKILRETAHSELPQHEEINFVLHVDGEEGWSWVNIRNNKNKDVRVQNSMERNETATPGPYYY